MSEPASPVAFSPPAAVVDVPLPPESAPTVDLTPLAAHVEELSRLQLQIADLKEAAARQRAVIENALGERETGLIDGRPAVSWTYVSSTRFDVTRFRTAHPDLAEEFLTESHTRRFTLRGGR